VVTLRAPRSPGVFATLPSAGLVDVTDSNRVDPSRAMTSLSQSPAWQFV